jgi:hypothetical protein
VETAVVETVAAEITAVETRDKPTNVVFDII